MRAVADEQTGWQRPTPTGWTRGTGSKLPWAGATGRVGCDQRPCPAAAGPAARRAKPHRIHTRAGRRDGRRQTGRVAGTGRPARTRLDPLGCQYRPPGSVLRAVASDRDSSLTRRCCSARGAHVQRTGAHSKCETARPSHARMAEELCHSPDKGCWRQQLPLRTCTAMQSCASKVKYSTVRLARVAQVNTKGQDDTWASSRVADGALRWAAGIPPAPPCL